MLVLSCILLALVLVIIAIAVDIATEEGHNPF